MVKMIGKKESGRTARYIFFFIVLLLDLAVLYPILNVLAVSFSSYAEYSANPMMVIPRGLNLHSYMKVFQNKKYLDRIRQHPLDYICRDGPGGDCDCAGSLFSV